MFLRPSPLVAILLASLITAHPAPPPPPTSPNHNNNNVSQRLRATIISPLQCIPYAPFALTLHKINPQACLKHTIPSICASLTFPFPPRGVWQWSSHPGCAMGFYLPPTLPRGGGVPSKTDCVEKVFGEMVQTCVLAPIKGGGGEGKEVGGLGMRNVKKLPDERDVGRGVVEGLPRFLMGGRIIG